MILFLRWTFWRRLSSSCRRGLGLKLKKKNLISTKRWLIFTASHHLCHHVPSRFIVGDVRSMSWMTPSRCVEWDTCAQDLLDGIGHVCKVVLNDSMWCLEWHGVIQELTRACNRIMCVCENVCCVCVGESGKNERGKKKRGGLPRLGVLQTWTKRDYCICYPSRSLQNGIFKCHHCYLIISNMEHCVIVSVEKCIFLGLSWWSLSSNTKVARNSHLPPSWKPWLVTCRCSREREVRIPRISSVSSHRPRTKIVPPVKNKNLHGGQA